MKVSDSHAGPRTKAAERAVDICKAWATKVAASLGCQFHLFGSAIYKGGEQFDPIHCDLDIVCHLPRNGDALWRANTIKQLHSAKLELELNVIRDLSRVSCTNPAVSIVVATPLEIDVNIHKSATRTFFDRITFYNLEQGKESLGLGGLAL